MNQYCRGGIALIILVSIAITACKKGGNNTTKNPSSAADSVSLKQKCYTASGTVALSNMGITGFTCDMACASYSSTAHIWADSYQTTLAFANQTGFGQVLNFVFNGKGFPKSGTYKAVTMFGMMGSSSRIADDEVVVHFLGPVSSKTSQNNTIKLVNDNGRITVSSDKIELFDIAGNAKSVASAISFTRNTTLK